MDNLIDWQWHHYADGHRDRRNLIIHLATVPLFMLGTVLAMAAPWLHAWALLGPVAMVTAVAVQGRTHRRESSAPLPFRGPADVIARLFVEQWITFPRYLASGAFARAWRGNVRPCESSSY